MKIGDLVVIEGHNIKGKIKSFYEEDHAIVETQGEHEYLIPKRDLRVIKERTHSTWR